MALNEGRRGWRPCVCVSAALVYICTDHSRLAVPSGKHTLRVEAVTYFFYIFYWAEYWEHCFDILYKLSRRCIWSLYLTLPSFVCAFTSRRERNDEAEMNAEQGRGGTETPSPRHTHTCTRARTDTHHVYSTCTQVYMSSGPHTFLGPTQLH